MRDILRMAQQPISLEKPIGEEEESELGDFVEDQTAESPFELASENLRRENVRRALDALPQREREVIEMRFGLTGGRPRTLEEVGRAFNVTRERIRQIENHTLKKLEVAARGAAPARRLEPPSSSAIPRRWIRRFAGRSEVRRVRGRPRPATPAEDSVARLSAPSAGYPSGQRDSAVNAAAQPSQVRILLPPFRPSAA